VGELNATVLQELEGSAHEFAGVCFQFAKSDTGRPATWVGGEGYAAPVQVIGHGKHILKMFHLPTMERHQRSVFLAALALHTLPLRDKPFSAAPTEAIRGVLRTVEGDKIEVFGNLAPFVEGERFGDLLRSGESPTWSARLSLARQLVIAVEVFEEAKLVHGDLSADNIMIVDPITDSPKLRLIDFDGFFHPEVPVVPCSRRQGGRAWGTPGYRSAAFRKTQDVVVTTDRVAMAALVAEVLLLLPDDADNFLERETLLSQRDIENGTPRIPKEIQDRCPDACSLLIDAVMAAAPDRAPSPKTWRDLITELSLGKGRHPRHHSEPPRSMEEQASPFLVLARCADAEDKRVKLPRPQGTLAPANPRMGWLSYELHEDTVHLTGVVPNTTERYQPLFVRLGGPGADLTRFLDEVDVQATLGDVIIWEDIQIYLS